MQSGADLEPTQTPLLLQSVASHCCKVIPFVSEVAFESIIFFFNFYMVKKIQYYQFYLLLFLNVKIFLISTNSKINHR